MYVYVYTYMCLGQLKYFMVGCGALGCEFVKNFGKTYITPTILHIHTMQCLLYYILVYIHTHLFSFHLYVLTYTDLNLNLT